MKGMGISLAKPLGISLVPKPAVDSRLKFTATIPSTIRIKQNGSYAGYWVIQYSLNGKLWSNYSFNTPIQLLAGESVYFRGMKDPVSQSSTNYRQFIMTGSIEASGDLTCLLNETGGVSDLSSYGDYTFYKMFYGCGVLKVAPSLPPKYLTQYCYSNMFNNCSQLTKSPDLPAETLVPYCYNLMFGHCGRLVEVHCDAKNISANDCTTNWMYVVSNTGDFYGKAAAAWKRTSSGIPSSWTAHLK